VTSRPHPVATAEHLLAASLPLVASASSPLPYRHRGPASITDRTGRPRGSKKIELLVAATHELATRFGERALARARAGGPGPAGPRAVIAAILAEGLPDDEESRQLTVVYTAYLGTVITSDSTLRFRSRQEVKEERARSLPLTCSWPRSAG